MAWESGGGGGIRSTSLRANGRPWSEGFMGFYLPPVKTMRLLAATHKCHAIPDLVEKYIGKRVASGDLGDCRLQVRLCPGPNAQEAPMHIAVHTGRYGAAWDRRGRTQPDSSCWPPRGRQAVNHWDVLTSQPTVDRSWDLSSRVLHFKPCATATARYVPVERLLLTS